MRREKEREREKRGFENETWDQRTVFGLAASWEGGILQPWQICNYLGLTQTLRNQALTITCLRSNTHTHTHTQKHAHASVSTSTDLDRISKSRKKNLSPGLILNTGSAAKQWFVHVSVRERVGAQSTI